MGPTRMTVVSNSAYQQTMTLDEVREHYIEPIALGMNVLSQPPLLALM